MERLCLNELLQISQETHIGFLNRFGNDVLPQKSLYFTFIAGCYAEIQSALGKAYAADIVHRCIVVSDNPDKLSGVGKTLKSIRLEQSKSGVNTILETEDGTITKFGESSVWLGCSSFGDFYLNSQNIFLVDSYLALGNLVNPKNGKVDWPRKSKSRQKILAYAAQAFKDGEKYSENEVNGKLALINDDYALIRREMIVEQYLSRMKDGSMYWLNPRRKGAC